jgi:hypothetical protein
VKTQKAARGKTVVWISFDLGVQGDYESLYRWLDAHDAQECGDNLAFLKKYEHSGSLSESLKRDLEGSIEINQRTRIYIVREVSGKPKGKFIFGSRKRPPWTGYAPEQIQEEDYAP